MVTNENDLKNPKHTIKNSINIIKHFKDDMNIS